MIPRTVARLVLASTAIVLLLLTAAEIGAQAKKLKIGVIFDYSGPLAGGGSDLHALGAKIMIDHFAKKGGVEGYQIEALYADAQSKPEVAINEAVRLIEQEKVDIPEGGTMLGFGVHFLGDGAMAGQNDRAFPVIVQYVDDKAYVVWPKSLQLREPALPLPSSSPYAN